VFDGVLVELGPRSGDSYPVVSGLSRGDLVAAAGAFLVDAENRLTPTAGTYIGASGHTSDMASSSVQSRHADTGTGPAEKAGPPAGDAGDPALKKPDAKALLNLAKLSPADRTAALAQQNCPITKAPLGSMGVPVKVEIAPGVNVFLCCDGCVDEAKSEPQKTAEKVAALRHAVEEQNQKK
jgi:hypothetical protein